MARSRGHRDRPRREPKKPKRSKFGKAPGRRFESHPLFGKIPMIEVTEQGPDGHDYRYDRHDPDFQPDLPQGAVRGNVHKQNFHPFFQTPRYFYVDVDRVCVQCGVDFVFSAKEQKYWYETLRFVFDSIAIRCPKCRGRRRTERALRQQMSVARQGLKDDPDNPALLLADAEACIRYRQRTGEGDLDRAIAAARAAAKIWPSAIEALFWEGLAHRLAGRPAKARTALKAFVDRSTGRKRHRKMEQEARDILRELDPADG